MAPPQSFAKEPCPQPPRQRNSSESSFRDIELNLRAVSIPLGICFPTSDRHEFSAPLRAHCSMSEPSRYGAPAEPAEPAPYTHLAGRSPVAQTSSLLYRGFPIRQRCEVRKPCRLEVQCH